MKNKTGIKGVLTTVFLLYASLLFSQTFTEQTSISMAGLANGSALWGDADNDGDIDILVAGTDAGNAFVVKLYRNNGSYTYSDNGTFSPAIPTVYSSYNVHAQWVDFDNDGYLDIILNLPSSSGASNLMIYRHEADHSYLLKSTIDYWTWQGNSIDCGDYDNDGDKDILLATHNASRIFQNQGNFVFKEQYSIKLDGLGETSSKFIDYNNDGKLDIFIMGFPDASYYGLGKIYKNNGNNSFTLQIGINLSVFYDGSADWGDYNNDGFPDLLATGKYGNTIINKNNGNNTFTPRYSITLMPATEGASKWGDLDNDGDLDIFLSGNSNNTKTTKIYINNGNDTFSELVGTSIDGLYKSSVDLFDYDNDNDLDILISGDNGSSRITKVFKNVPPLVNPLPSAPANLTATIIGNDVVLKWKSVRTDNTNYKALTYNIMVGTSSGAVNTLSPDSRTSDGMRLISGMGNAQLDTTFTLRNLTRGLTYYWKVQAVDNSWKGSAFTAGPNFGYTAVIQAGSLNVPAVDGSSATLTWTRGNGTNCAVFVREANSGNALPVNGTGYTSNSIFKSGTQIGTSGWYCVYAGTGTTVNVTNLNAATDYIFQVIEYTGSGASSIYDTSTSTENPFTFKTGSFTEIKTANLLPVTSPSITRPSSAYWADFDNDVANGNDLDLLIRGSNFTRLYRYDGSNTFTLLPASFNNGYSSACGDYNNDGLVDIAIACYPEVALYKNTGNGTFALQAGALPVTGEYGALDWGDFNNDGFLDIIITSSSSTAGITSRIFRNINGTSFTEQQSISLTGMAYGSAEWADYDNDGFNDLIIAGSTSDASYITRIYRNTGNNNFTEQSGITISGTSGSTIDWGDYDNDGFLDFIITGFNLFTPITKVYRSMGTNGFSEQTSITLPQVNNGSAKWGDYDNDGDLDILLTGYTGFYKSSLTKIFKNNGDGTFTEDQLPIMPGLGASSGTWGDYDKDGDLDIVLTGNLPDGPVSKIYRNDLNIANSAPTAPASPTATVNKSDVTLKWNSVRTDNTPYKTITYNLKVGTGSGAINIMAPNSTSSGLRRIAESGNAGQDTTFIFKKMTFGTYYWSVQAVDNGLTGSAFSLEGNFTVSPVQAASLSATILDNNSLKLKWERGNGDRCVVFAKQTSADQALPVNNSGYIADAEYGFGSQIGSSGWYCIYNGRVDSVVVTGLIYNKQYSFHIFEYMGNFGSEQYFTQIADGNPGVFSTSLFTEQTGITLNSGVFNNVSWGDYDKDGFVDILVPGSPLSRIYRNNGNNTFTEKTGIALPSVNYGAAEWGDYDKDGDLDIIITGATVNYPVSGPLTKIFRNDGSDIFTEQISISLKQLFYSSVAWGDYDNDGDLDILINGASGTSPNYTGSSIIYENNGNNSFTEKTQISLKGLYRGSVRWIDYDNDGDLDIVMTGAEMETQFNSEGFLKIYRNNGNKTYTDQTVNGVGNEASNSSTAWGDYDNDGDLDFMFTARGFMTLYTNLGGNNFASHLSVSLPFQGACYAAWGDYDNDGYLDIILSNPGLDTKIYRNTHGISIPGAASQWFNKQDDDAVKSIGYSFVNWVDYDNDGDLDFLLSKDSGLPTKIFKNNLVMNSGLFKINTAPEAPAGLGYSNTPLGVVLKWNPAKDNETASGSRTYNLRIGTTKANFNITPSHSSLTGYREISAMGNAQLDTTYLLINMPATKYYWSVQSVDQTFKGSGWSPVDSFQVKNVLALFSADTVCLGLNTTFSNQSVGFGETIQSYKWIFENGETSDLANPTYTFGSSGVKNVKLIVYSSTTSDTLVKQVLVKAKPLLDFSASVACLGTETTLTNLSNVAGLIITSWSWDYGDGKGSAAMNPGTHGYLNPGNYDVILEATADNNCSESITKIVTVAAYPIASVSATTPLSFCSGDSVSLSVASYTNHTYRWISNGVDVTGGNTNRITAKNTGNYSVEVINLTGNCRTTSSPAAVTVLSAPVAPIITAPAFTTICENDSVLLVVSYTIGYSYQWKLNGGAVGTNSSQHYARNSGTYTITVSNSNGCSVSSTNQIPVTINSLPVVGNISMSGNDVKFCRGGSITLSVPQNAGYSYNWRRGTTDLGLFTNSITASENGDYSVVVSSQFNCRTTTNHVSIEVVELPAEPAIDYGSYKHGDCLKETPLRLSVKDAVQKYTYKWYKNGTPIGNSTFIETREEGKYYVESIYDICKSDTASIAIDLQPILQKPEIIVKGSNVWYLSTTSKASLYKWYYNGAVITGAESSIYVAGQNLGLYRVAVSDGSGCYAYSDTVRIKGSGITGIEDPDPFKTLVVYPNPSSGVFNLQMNNNLIGKLTIRIFNQAGKKVFDREFEKNDEKFLQQIDIGQQRIGLYLISLYINGQISNTKFIVE